MTSNIKIAPSILSADFSRLGEEIKVVEAGGADLLHVDVMDGHFVPNITIGPEVVAAIKNHTSLPLDVHLMISNPAHFVKRFAEAGADWITVHIEATNHINRLVQQIKDLKVKVGVAINPGTSLSALDAILTEIDYVLLMSVNPGFGGQSFIASSTEKVSKLSKKIKDHNAKVEIEVDGGVTVDTVSPLAAAGATIFVAGNAVYGAKQPGKAISLIRNSALAANA